MQVAGGTKFLPFFWTRSEIRIATASAPASASGFLNVWVQLANGVFPLYIHPVPWSTGTFPTEHAVGRGWACHKHTGNHTILTDCHKTIEQ